MKKKLNFCKEELKNNAKKCKTNWMSMKSSFFFQKINFIKMKQKQIN